MKKILFLGFLTLLFTALLCEDVDAQSRKKKKKKSSTKKEKTDEYFDESGFANKLWYGGGFTLGYSGGQNQSAFAFGLSPMVGYKLVGDIVSAGPRAGFTYNHIRLKSGGTVFKTSPLSYSIGAFTRIKPFENFFGHFEYEFQNTDSTDPDEDGFIEITPDGKIVTTKVSYNNVYIGAGYNSGGLFGYEILLLYNVNQPDDTVRSPFDIRFGFTYKF